MSVLGLWHSFYVKNVLYMQFLDNYLIFDVTSSVFVSNSINRKRSVQTEPSGSAEQFPVLRPRETARSTTKVNIQRLFSWTEITKKFQSFSERTATKEALSLEVSLRWRHVYFCSLNFSVCRRPSLFAEFLSLQIR